MSPPHYYSVTWMPQIAARETYTGGIIYSHVIIIHKAKERMEEASKIKQTTRQTQACAYSVISQVDTIGNPLEKFYNSIRVSGVNHEVSQ